MPNDDGLAEMLTGILCFFAGFGVRDLADHLIRTARKRGIGSHDRTYGQ